MKPRQPELRGIPQFDSGRWKLRLEFVPLDPDNETTIGNDFDSAQAGVTRLLRHIGSCHQANATRVNNKHPVNESEGASD